MNEDEKNLTGQYMIGKWSSKSANTDFTIEISERTVRLSGTLNGESINVEFSNSNWWVGEFLFFTSNQKYFIQYANEKHLGFGELIIPGIMGEIKWGLKFDRIDIKKL